MLARKSGNIINMASVASSIKGRYTSAELHTVEYCGPSKAALTSMTMFIVILLAAIIAQRVSLCE